MAELTMRPTNVLVLATLALFYVVLAELAIHPRVGDLYRLYYIARALDVCPGDLKKMHPLTPGDALARQSSDVIAIDWGGASYVLFRVDKARRFAGRIRLAVDGTQSIKVTLNDRPLGAVNFDGHDPERSVSFAPSFFGDETNVLVLRRADGHAVPWRELILE